MIKVVKRVEIPDLHSIVIQGLNSVSLVLTAQTNSFLAQQREEDISIEFTPEDLNKLRLIVQHLEEIRKRQLYDQIDGARLKLQQLESSHRQTNSDLDGMSGCAFTQNACCNGSNGHLTPQSCGESEGSNLSF